MYLKCRDRSEVPIPLKKLFDEIEMPGVEVEYSSVPEVFYLTLMANRDGERLHFRMMFRDPQMWDRNFLMMRLVSGYESLCMRLARRDFLYQGKPIA